MEPVTYKEYHESFMKNNNGSSIEDVFLTVMPTFFTTFLATNLIFVAQPLGIAATLLIEFVFVVVSTVLHVTIMHHRVWEIALTLFCVLVTVVVKQLYGRTHVAKFVQVPCQRPEYLNGFRGCINLLTAVCILAVDFKCFPRKLAKTETYGFGLMDIGVGLFVFGNGLVAPELRKARDRQRLSWKRLEKTVRGCLPLVILGAVRFAATSELDYQQHVSEYGVHWNFFLTLACTKFFGTILLGILPHFEYTKYVSIALLFTHELMLQLGVAEYVIDPSKQIKRDNFQDANREGICSIMGYVALYLAAVYIGYRLRKEEIVSENNREAPVFTNVRQLFWKTVRLFFVALILWKVTYILKSMFGVSRRIANMGYVFWVLSVGTTVTVCFMLMEIFCHFRIFERPTPDEAEEESPSEKRIYMPIILSGITYNGLVFFLLANLMTGIVNMCFQTFLLNTAQSLAIIFAYTFTLCTITTFLYLKKIKLKAW